MRRIRVRIGEILLIVAMVVVGFAFVKNVGFEGSCPDASELKATWAERPAGVTKVERNVAIADTMRCIDMVGKTREQIQLDLGDWTSAKEYRPATEGGRAGFLVWSNGSKSDGVRVDFNGKGIARSAQEYRPKG